jgi:hypothetical protein
MFRLAKDLGSEASDDPSLLHPLFSRLPPLVADTPDQTELPPIEFDSSDDSVNPYEPIALSRVFQITDELMARYPWHGPDIRGQDIMGPGSVVVTYEHEVEGKGAPWSLRQAEDFTNKHVVLPGATEPDEEDAVPDKEPRPSRKPRRRISSGTAIAVGVLAIGIGMSVYGYRAESSRSGWAGWWSVVMRSWVSRTGMEESLRGWSRVASFVQKALTGVM